MTKFAVGDVVGVGCIVDSCGKCQSCTGGDEQYCEGPVSWTATYNGYMKPDGNGFNTLGGYSISMTVNQSFVLRIPGRRLAGYGLGLACSKQHPANGKTCLMTGLGLSLAFD